MTPALAQPSFGRKASQAAGAVVLFGGLFALAALTGLLIAVGNGNPAMAFAVPVGAGALYGMWKLPLRYSAMGVLFLMFVADYLPEGPYSNYWASPFSLLGQFLFLNLSALSGIGALRFPGLDLMVIALLALSGIRRALGIRIDVRAPGARLLNGVLMVELAAVVGLDVWGTLTGGNFNESLWQLRQLLLLPMMTFMFMAAIPGRTKDLKLIAKVMVAGAVIKAFCGMYFHFMVVRPQGLVVEFTTSHSDTLLFVPLLGMQIAFFFFTKRIRAAWRTALVWLPIVVYGMILNDRRLAYVSLGGCFLCLMLMVDARHTARRKVLKAFIVLSPLIAVYTGAGWNSNNPVFGGAQLIKSLIKGDQAQSGADYRDIENFDVLYTWSEASPMPAGFGHTFLEPVKLPDISFAMPTYQYHPHNTILWMWTIGGVFGFFALFAPMVACVFLAARAFRRATDPIDQTACMTCIFMVIAHVNQCFGDMGTRTYFGSMGMAVAMAVASKLAVRLGAWPAPTVARGAQYEALPPISQLGPTDETIRLPPGAGVR